MGPPSGRRRQQSLSYRGPVAHRRHDMPESARSFPIVPAAHPGPREHASGAPAPARSPLSRPRWVARRMMTIMQKLRYLDALGLVGQGSQGPRRDPGSPQVGDTATDPHRKPTDETAHSGTLVMRVKGTENSRSPAWMGINW